MRAVVRNLLWGCHFIISAVMLIAGMGFIALFAAPFAGLMEWWPIVLFRRLVDPSLLRILELLSLPNPEIALFTPLVIGIVVLWLRLIVSSYLESYRQRFRACPPAPKFVPFLATGPGQPAACDELRFAVAAPDSEKKRKQLLKQYWEIEHALKQTAKKRCTFLSADVVGSTKMKVGQRDTDVAASFDAYERMLKCIFADFGAWKEAWTPDGVMICFLDRDLAVGAARRLLENLGQFNANFNKLTIPFSVRCGINEGEVSIYDDSTLERVADCVIDVAGHMQKYAPADQLWLSAHVYDLLADKAGFVSVEQEVDGHKVYAWGLPARGESGTA